jgi:hypothetical protein
MVMKLAITDPLVVVGIVPFPDDRGLVAALLEVPVHAVVGGIGDAVLEPLDADIGTAKEVFFTLV